MNIEIVTADKEDAQEPADEQEVEEDLEPESESENPKGVPDDAIPMLDEDGNPNPELTNYNENKNSEPEPEPEPEDENEAPEFSDDLSEMELQNAIVEYSEWASDSYPSLLGVDMNDVTVEVSNRMERTAGKLKYKEDCSVLTTRYSYQAYQEWGWDGIAETVRHELIHVWQVVKFGNADHGRTFKKKAEKLNTTINCEQFKEYKYEFYCTNCNELIGGRYRDCKKVRNPESLNSKCCGANLRVEKN